MTRMDHYLYDKTCSKKLLNEPHMPILNFFGFTIILSRKDYIIIYFSTYIFFVYNEIFKTVFKWHFGIILKSNIRSLFLQTCLLIKFQQWLWSRDLRSTWTIVTHLIVINCKFLLHIKMESHRSHFLDTGIFYFWDRLKAYSSFQAKQSQVVHIK